jgi:hypothetical protein
VLGRKAVTIAACYISPEGVVLGADSTSTYAGQSGHQHYYNHAQKLFELSTKPEHGTLGAVTWGLGGLQISSHRTLLAEFSDDIEANPPASVADAANRWAARFWTAYSDPSCPIAPHIAQCKALEAKKPHDPNAPADPGMRTQAEEQELATLQNTFASGFCIAGYALPDRKPAAYEIIFNPSLAAAPTPKSVPRVGFWGAPNMIQRLIMGGDDDLKNSLMKSPQWTGTRAELDALMLQHTLAHPIIPIRDAIDFVHACIYSTIKAYKFSSLSQICGGPIELAVITTDRPFRWVRHKEWDAAVAAGGL